MEKKQTAFDYLIHNLNPKPITKEEHQEWWDTLAKVQQMEKEQIMDAFVECWKSNISEGIECKLSAEEYYYKTYGNAN